MKNTILRQPLWVTIGIFTLLLGLFWVNHLTSAISAQSAIYNPAPFGQAVNSWIAGSPYIDAAMSILLTFMTALVLTRIISRNLVFPARTYIFITIYVAICYGFFIHNDTLPVAIAAYLVAKGAEYLAASFRRSVSFSELFRSGFVLGLAPLFYAPSVIYILLLFIAIPVYLRTVREAFVGLTGLILPILTYSYIMWGTGDPFLQPLITLWDAVTNDGGGFMPPFYPHSPAGFLRLSAAAAVIAALVLSLGTFVLNPRGMRTRALRIYSFFVFFLLIAGIAMFLPCASTGDLPLTAIPASVVGSHYFSRHPGIPATILYFLLLGSIITGNLV